MPAPKNKDFLEVFSRFWLIVGALVLGYLGAFGKNPVQEVLTTMPTLAQIIYCFIGFSGLYELWVMLGRK